MIWQKLKELLGIEAKEPVVFHEEWIALLQQNVPLYAGQVMRTRSYFHLN